MKNILYYRFITLTNLEDLREEHEFTAKRLGLFGKVILSSEGINGCMSGEDDAIERYNVYIKIKYGLEDDDIKITSTNTHTFRKLWIKIKPQIINTKNWNAMIGNKGDYITPKEFKKLMDDNEDIIILDARNNYEYDAGHFKKAIYPKIRTFSKFNELLTELEPHKEKTIVSYCTGGIRCEKASAFLKENGFKNIKQLHGGIINYAKKFGSEHWEGKCLVFDNRNELDMDAIKE
jgi:UPF0176 protein